MIDTLILLVFYYILKYLMCLLDELSYTDIYSNISISFCSYKF